MTEGALRAFIEENGLKWNQIPVFVDEFSLMAHGSEGYARTSSELTDRIKNMRQNGVSDPVAIRTIVSFEQLYPMGWSISSDVLKNGEAFPDTLALGQNILKRLKKLPLELVHT